MHPPTASVRAWAQRLLALEATNPPASAPHVREAERIAEKLRLPLTRLIGASGFTALLRRALALAKAEIPLLQTVNVTTTGRLEGIEADAAHAGNDDEAAIAVATHLLNLMVTFIGEPLTIRLLQDVWPDAGLQSPVVQSKDFS